MHVQQTQIMLKSLLFLWRIMLEASYQYWSWAPNSVSMMESYHQRDASCIAVMNEAEGAMHHATCLHALLHWYFMIKPTLSSWMMTAAMKALSACCNCLSWGGCNQCTITTTPCSSTMSSLFAAIAIVVGIVVILIVIVELPSSLVVLSLYASMLPPQTLTFWLLFFNIVGVCHPPYWQQLQCLSNFCLWYSLSYYHDCHCFCWCLCGTILLTRGDITAQCQHQHFQLWQADCCLDIAVTLCHPPPRWICITAQHHRWHHWSFQAACYFVMSGASLL